MTVPPGIFDSYDAKGNREDLADIIFNVSPTETPFQMMAMRGRTTNRLHDWQADGLALAALNKQLEGDDAVGNVLTATQRLQNFTMISTKVVVISGTQEVVDKAGRKSELAYQLAKAGKELKRDMEVGLTRNQDGVAADSPRVLWPLETWYGTLQGVAGIAPPAQNQFRGATGVGNALAGLSPDGLLADGTPRALTESLLKSAIQACWENGGEPGVIMVGAFNKTVISAFTGNSTRFDQGEDKRLVTAIDIYVSDFGSHRIVPNRFSRKETAHVLTMHLWSVDYLRAFKQIPLAITGDNMRRQLICEYTLKACNESGSAVVADLTFA